MQCASRFYFLSNIVLHSYHDIKYHSPKLPGIFTVILCINCPTHPVFMLVFIILQKLYFLRLITNCYFLPKCVHVFVVEVLKLVKCKRNVNQYNFLCHDLLQYWLYSIVLCMLMLFFKMICSWNKLSTTGKFPHKLISLNQSCEDMCTVDVHHNIHIKQHQYKL